MKRLVAWALMGCACCLRAAGQDGLPVDFPSDREESMPQIQSRHTEATPRPVPTISLGELQPTPEMWFYEQALIQRQDPWVAIRSRAEFRANQRERRIAAREWYGYSAARPVASPWPYNDTYSPMWRSNGYNPFQWRAGQSVTIVERTASAPSTRYGMW